MKRHAGKIVVGFLLLFLVATIWGGAHGLGRVRRLCNRTNTRARELEGYLDGDFVAPGIEMPPFQSGEVFTRVQIDWGTGVGPQRFPSDLLGTRRAER